MILKIVSMFKGKLSVYFWFNTSHKIQKQKDQRCLMKMFFTLQFIASTSICYEKILLQPCLAKSLWKSLCFYVKYESALEAPVTIGNFF